VSAEVLTIFMFVGLFIGVLLGFPVAFTMIGISLIAGYLSIGGLVLAFSGNAINTVIGEFAFVAVPMFVFMGCILERTGLAKNSFEVLSQWLRKVRGGLGISSVILCMMFAACIGILGASVTTVGILALGPMIKKGYDKGFATGIVAAGGSLGILLPPSIVLILFAVIAAVSMMRLFVAAVVPGIILGILYAIYAGVIGYLKKGVVPEISLEDDDMPVKYNLTQSLSAFLPFVILIFLVLGALVFGIAAPTEVAAFGGLGSIAVAFAYKKCNLEILKGAMIQSIGVTAMVMLVAAAAMMFTSVFFIIGGRQVVMNFIEFLGLGGNGIFFLFIIIIFVMGLCVDWIGVSMVMVPIFIPLLISHGFDPIHVSVVVLVLLQTSFLTPPFAQSILYALSVVPEDIEIKTAEAYKGAVPFICIQLFVAIICILFPSVVTFLPNMMLG